MRVYKVNLSTKTFIIVTCLFISIIGIFFLIYNNQASIFQRIIALLAIMLFIGGSYAMYKFKVLIDDDRIGVIQIDITQLFLQKRLKSINTSSSLLWNEIGELDTIYILFPEFLGTIALKPKLGLSKKPVKFPIAGMPLQLIQDILSHLSPDTKIYLYPYLKRKVEGKQTWFYKK